MPAGQRLGSAVVQTRAFVWALESSAASASHAVLRWPRSAARLDPASAARCAVPHALHCVLATADAPDALVLIGARGEVSVLAAGSSGTAGGKDAGSALTGIAANAAADDVIIVDAQVQAVGAELIITCVRFGRSSPSAGRGGYVLDVWTAPASAQSAPTHVASFALRGDSAAAPVAPLVAVSAASSSSTSASAAAAAAAAAGRPKKGGKRAAAASAASDEADTMAVSADSGASSPSSSSFGPALLSLAAHWPSRQLSLCFADGRWAVVAFAAHGSLAAALRGGGNKASGGNGGSGSASGPLLRCSRAMHALTMSADAQTSYAPLDRYAAPLSIEKIVYFSHHKA